MDEWGRSRVGDLTDLCEAALPAERLTADELLSACWDQPGAVLALPDGDGAVALARCADGDGDGGHPRSIGAITLLAVVPAAQGHGRGRALLAAADAWLFDHGAEEIVVGPPTPPHLWPGVELTNVPARCLFESAGYEPYGTVEHLSCPTTYRARPPAGVEVRRALADEDGEAVLALVAAEGPHWLPEVQRAIDHGACLVAFDDAGAALGFVCHSVHRTGWLGPLAVAAARRGQGVGRALLGEVCKDLMIAGLPTADITCSSPLAFYARTAHASVARVYQTLRRARGAGDPAAGGTR